jgi:signal recognition particle receptor subunit alpha
MLDLACIFTTGGVLLFCKTFCEMSLEVVNEFIFNILVQEKFNEKSYKSKNRIFLWRFDPEVKLVFLFVYQELFQAFDFEEMLKYTRAYYKKNVLPQVARKGDMVLHVPDFEAQFTNIYKQFNKKHNKEQTSKNKPKERRGESRVLEEGGDADDEKPDGPDEEEDAMNDRAGNGAGEAEGKPSEKTGPVLQSALKNQERESPPKHVTIREDAKPDSTERMVEVVQPPQKQMTAREIAAMKQKERNEKSKIGKGSSQIIENSSPGKADRVWSSTDKVTGKQMEGLDFSSKLSGSKEDASAKNQAFFDNDEEIDLDFELISDDESKKEGQKTKKSSILSSFKNSLKNFTTGSKTLTEDELAKILEKFQDDLMAKNVAEEIARNIVASLKLRLLNQKLSVFTSVSETVKSTLKESLTKILTPKKNYDILSEALKARERGEPYVIAFIGVNGVGKSTNLAKVGYLFKSQVDASKTGLFFDARGLRQLQSGSSRAAEDPRQSPRRACV